MGVASFALESAAAIRAKTPAGSDTIDPSLTHIANTAADLGQFVRYSLIDLVSAPTGEGASTAQQEHMPINRSARYHMHPLVYAHATNALKHAQQEEIEEARRNLTMDRLAAVPGLKRLLESVSTVDAPQGLKLPKTIRLDPKDPPILLAAIQGRADYLLTGDARHFGHLYDKQIEGVLVLRRHSI